MTFMLTVARPSFWISLFLVFCAFCTSAQVTLSGYLRDAESGETLVGANVYLAENPAIGTVANAYGFYSLSVEPGTYQVVYSYLGYDEQRLTLDLTGDTRQNVRMTSGLTIEKVVVTANDEDRSSFIVFGRRTYVLDLVQPTLRWNHLFNDKLFSNVSVIYNDYDSQCCLELQLDVGMLKNRTCCISDSYIVVEII
jgi:hypothetical protein